MKRALGSGGMFLRTEFFKSLPLIRPGKRLGMWLQFSVLSVMLLFCGLSASADEGKKPLPKLGETYFFVTEDFDATLETRSSVYFITNDSVEYRTVFSGIMNSLLERTAGMAVDPTDRATIEKIKQKHQKIITQNDCIFTTEFDQFIFYVDRDIDFCASLIIDNSNEMKRFLIAIADKADCPKGLDFATFRIEAQPALISIGTSILGSGSESLVRRLVVYLFERLSTDCPY